MGWSPKTDVRRAANLRAASHCRLGKDAAKVDVDVFLCVCDEIGGGKAFQKALPNHRLRPRRPNPSIAGQREGRKACTPRTVSHSPTIPNKHKQHHLARRLSWVLDTGTTTRPLQAHQHHLAPPQPQGLPAGRGKKRPQPHLAAKLLLPPPFSTPLGFLPPASHRRLVSPISAPHTALYAIFAL